VHCSEPTAPLAYGWRRRKHHIFSASAVPLGEVCHLARPAGCSVGDFENRRIDNGRGPKPSRFGFRVPRAVPACFQRGLGRPTVILLDTHTRVWWVSRPDRLQPRRRELLELGADRVFGVNVISCTALTEHHSRDAPRDRSVVTNPAPPPQIHPKSSPPNNPVTRVGCLTGLGKPVPAAGQRRCLLNRHGTADGVD
jgi:hypothetical protein